MDNLFDFVGVDLPQENLIVSNVVLKSLAKEASENTSLHSGISIEKLSSDILYVLKNFFKSDDKKPLSNQDIKSTSVTAIANYLLIQDVLECRSMKEIHSLASGLYDSVLIHIASIVKSTTLKELECNVFPYVRSPRESSNDMLIKLQAAD